MTSGRGRFKYHDNGLTVYKLGDLVEQYLTCDEYFWWQVLRVSKKTFRCKVFYHTKEEEKVKIWKTFRTLERVERPLNEYTNEQKTKAGQFRLTWMSSSELSQALHILKKKGKEEDEEYKALMGIMDMAMVKKREGEEAMQYQNSCCLSFSCFYCDCGGCIF